MRPVFVTDKFRFSDELIESYSFNNKNDTKSRILERLRAITEIISTAIFLLSELHSCLFLLSKFIKEFQQSKKISNDQELIQSDPISCPQNQKGNN